MCVGDEEAEVVMRENGMIEELIEKKWRSEEESVAFGERCI